MAECCEDNAKDMLMEPELSDLKSTNKYFLWTCLTFPATVIAKIERLYHIQILPFMM